jgi:hypothetical protein
MFGACREAMCELERSLVSVDEILTHVVGNDMKGRGGRVEKRFSNGFRTASRDEVVDS